MSSMKSTNPKVIHRIYFHNYSPFHDPFLHFLESWRREMPNYDIKLWGPENLDVNANAWTKIAAAKNAPVFLSEYFRWKVLLEYGGLYLDADCEIIDGKVLDRLLDELYSQDEYDCFFGVEETSNGHPTAQTFAAKPGCEIVRFMVDLYENRLDPLWAWRETRGLIGPQLLSLYFLNRGIRTEDDGFFKKLEEPVVAARAKVFPQRYFSPKFSLMGDVLDFREGETCVYHMFANSNVDFSSNKKLQSARKLALTFEEYRKELESSTKFPREYHASHFSVRDGVHRDEGVEGFGSGLLMYGPYISLPRGDYVARLNLLKRPKKGALLLNATANSGALHLGGGRIDCKASGKAPLEVAFRVDAESVNMTEITVGLENVDRILVSSVTISESGAVPAGLQVSDKLPAAPRSGLKRIHRVYFGFDGKPDPFERYLNTWKVQLPDFEILHWNASNLPMDDNDFVRQLYAEKDHAFLTDYFRWYLLREMGGSYFDADLEVVNGSAYSRLVTELENAADYDAFIGIDEKSGGWYTAHSMASKPGSALATFMCDVYDNFGRFTAWRKKGLYFWAPQLVGLYFADRNFNKDGMGTMPHLTAPQVAERVKVYPQDWFSPLAPTGQTEKPFDLSGYSENTTLCHHFACSWHDDSSIYLAHSRSKGGQSKILLSELAVADGRTIVTEVYPPDALHMSFSPAGARLHTAVGASNGGVIAAQGHSGYLVHGLSQPISKGAYRAAFALTRIFKNGRITIEITGNGGKTSLGETIIDIPAAAESGLVYCDFDVISDVGDLDCRLITDDSAEFCVTELTIDRRVPLK